MRECERTLEAPAYLAREHMDEAIVAGRGHGQRVVAECRVEDRHIPGLQKREHVARPCVPQPDAAVVARTQDLGSVRTEVRRSRRGRIALENRSRAITQ